MNLIGPFECFGGNKSIYAMYFLKFVFFSVYNDHAFFSTSSFRNTQVTKRLTEYLWAKQLRTFLVIRLSEP